MKQIKLTLDDLSSTIGHGIVDAELMCDHCEDFMELKYDHQEHTWKGTCKTCYLSYMLDVAFFINRNVQEYSCNWDEELKKL